MRKISLVLILCLLFLTACGAKNKLPQEGTDQNPTESQQEQSSKGSVEEVQEKVEDYFPLVKDVHMKYRGEGNEYAEYETYVDYVKDGIIQIREMTPGTVMAKVYKVSGGELKEVFSQGETYYRHDYTLSVNRDEVLIKEPIKEGTSWTLADGSARSITGVGKDVKTPAGEFKALEITTDMKDSLIKDYYVKNIGIVKTEYRDKKDIFTVLSELEKLEKGVTIKESIRFYYPDFLKDRLAYVDKDVKLSTNDDLLPIFEKEFKSIPEGSELTKVLTPNVKIKGCSIDEEEGILTVDFSSNLISEMNAGSGLEMMIVKSIANTLGGYYQKDKVVITLDGKEYESGHILLKSGEYFKVDTKGAVEYGK